MAYLWRFYYISYCFQARPAPKPKFVVLVCKDTKYMGFLVNSGIHSFIQRQPDLLCCQILVKNFDYKFLDHNSYIDCSELFEFDDSDLISPRDPVSNITKKAIQKAVSNAKTIPPYYKKLISS